MWCDFLVTLGAELVYTGRVVKMVLEAKYKQEREHTSQQRCFSRPSIYTLQRFLGG